MAQASSTTNCFWSRDKRGQLRLISDVAANDSDKTLTVPAGVFWEVMWAYASLATTATVGNRLLTLEAGDGTSVVGVAKPYQVQTASGTEYYNWGMYGAASESPATFHFIPLPAFFLPTGYTMRFYDSAAVDAAADDLTVYMLVAEYPAG